MWISQITSPSTICILSSKLESPWDPMEYAKIPGWFESLTLCSWASSRDSYFGPSPNTNPFFERTTFGAFFQYKYQCYQCYQCHKLCDKENAKEKYWEKTTKWMVTLKMVLIAQGFAMEVASCTDKRWNKRWNSNLLFIFLKLIKMMSVCVLGIWKIILDLTLL